MSKRVKVVGGVKEQCEKERSIKRKIKEAYLSYQLNKNYSKEKILEMYLNTISF
jgi:membrane peptidoglycan carboxypeptidase